MGSCAAPSAKGDDKFITTDYLQQCQSSYILRGSWLLSLPLPGAFICIKAGTYVNERILGTNYFLNKADVKIYSIGKLLDAASAAWRRQMRLHVSVESNGAESPA